jgi:transcriptional regulator with XRE-family HTH domain
MGPFGETVLAWRLDRGLTQAQLAQAARLPRPNLSAIERGDREVTLRTLRALAAALGIRPGVLADGVLPAEGQRPLSRAALERVALAAASGISLSDAREARLARLLTTAARTQINREARRPPSRAADRAYFLLKTSEPPETIASLLERLADARQRTSSRKAGR